MLGKETLSAIDIDTHARVNYHVVFQQFGGLRKALEAAGMKPSRFVNATDAELMKLVADLWTITKRESNGRRPRTGDVAKVADFRYPCQLLSTGSERGRRR